MLIVRDEQLRAFSEAARQRLIVTLSRKIVNHPLRHSALRPPSELSGWVNNFIERSRAYGMTKEREILSFMFFALENGWYNDDDSGFLWARRILHDSRVSDAAAKLALVLDEQRFRTHLADMNSRVIALLRDEPNKHTFD